MAPSLACFYSEDTSGSSPSVFEPAQAAFDHALEILDHNTTKQYKKRQQIFKAATLQDVLDVVTRAQEDYESKHKKSKTSKWITEFSKRLCHYGKVMDVLVQQHPEYVALAWGAMKLVFGAVVEHETLGRTIVTGLCDVADALPRVEMAAYLYPSNHVKQAVSILYALIIKFLLRALDWYEKGKIAHAVHSITQPAALRYHDLLKDIERATRGISDLAITSSQAEQRDMHNELRGLTSMVKKLQEDMLLDQSIKSSAISECRLALSDIQVTQALIFVSSACSIDHKASLQLSLLIRDKHRLVSRRSRCPPFWTSSDLRNWNISQHSSSITVRAPFKSRLYIHDFCANVIEQLRNSQVVVLWVLKPRNQTRYSLLDVLKSLVYQVLSINHVAHTDSSLTSHVRHFLDAYTEDDYLNLLGKLLQRIKLAYIMVEAGALEPASVSRCAAHLQGLVRRLSEHDAATILRIMFLSSGPDVPYQSENSRLVLRLGKLSHRKGQKMPMEPLQSGTNARRQGLRRGCAGALLLLRTQRVCR